MKIRIKKNIKKCMCGLFAMMMSLGIVANNSLNVKAISGVTDGITYPDWFVADPGSGVRDEHEDYITVNGETVFCIDAFGRYKRGVTVTEGTFAEAGISEATAKKCSLIAYYGTKVPGRTGKDWYAITQGLLWKTIHEAQGHTNMCYVVTPTNPDYATTQKLWNEILADVDRYYTMPSFSSSSHELDVLQTIELTDTKGVLKDMVVSDDGGLGVKIVGNKLQITGKVTSPEDTTITLKKNIAASETGTSIVYQAPGIQKTASFKVADPVKVKFKVHVNKYGSLELTKVNDKGDLLDGAVFNLKSITDGINYDKNVTVKDGRITVDKLIIGDYILTEVSAPDHHAITVKSYQVNIKVNETTERIVVNRLRPTGNITLNKQVEEGSNVIEGVVKDPSGIKYSLTAKEDIYDSVSLEKLYSKGDGIDADAEKGISSNLNSEKGIYTLDSTGKLNVTGLPMGKYELKEVSTNPGYILDEETKEIEFKQADFTTKEYNYNGEALNKITKVEVSKQDISSDEELEGASLQVLDKDGNVVDSWTSSNEKHMINGLTAQETYTLHEDLAPLGYAVASDVVFKVDNTGNVQKVEMKDFSNRVSKVDDDNKYIKGAKLQVVSTKHKAIVDEWVTGQNIISLDDSQKATLKEKGTLTGEVVKNNALGDETTYNFTISKKESDYSLKLIDKNSEEVSYYDIDEEGNETTHMINSLIEGNEYVLKEIETPKGYATAEDVKFVANSDTKVIKMVDQITKVEISKQDATTGKELPGASLTITDKETGKVIEKWTSTDKAHVIKGLEVKKTYIFHEDLAPTGYKVASDIEFTIKNSGDVQKVVMKDEAKKVVVNTGDTTNIFGFVMLLIGAVIGLGYVIIKKRNNDE